jgi:hypothetical protein
VVMFLFKTPNVSESGTSSVDWTQLSRSHLKTETESSFRNLAFLNKNGTMDNVQKHNNCIDKLMFPQVNKKFLAFMEKEGSLPCSQEHITGHFPGIVESATSPCTLFRCYVSACPVGTGADCPAPV